jgi:hypothetical protein
LSPIPRYQRRKENKERNKEGTTKEKSDTNAIDAQVSTGASSGRMGLQRKNTDQGKEDEQYKRGKHDSTRNTVPQQEDMLD